MEQSNWQTVTYVEDGKMILGVRSFQEFNQSMKEGDVYVSYMEFPPSTEITIDMTPQELKVNIGNGRITYRIK